ncbi:uncharacterized protein IUM83_16633 [Phytophthora cinnamomi]|uniref:uncharacterized protein n=1 Tax=Phytophthora cinnamomi TaxID=4785 RepID=UPI00355A54AC|nr:hypothetical protein IUM83_16633 [Phytophthora cinnamomi]
MKDKLDHLLGRDVLYVHLELREHGHQRLDRLLHEGGRACTSCGMPASLMVSSARYKLSILVTCWSSLQLQYQNIKKSVR